jgi:HNH endonuclease
MPCPGADPVEGHDFVYECIYCRTRTGTEAFNREHVLSDAFGTFKDALVLHQYVCRNCNQFFADGIERELTRDAFEAILRYRKGIKKPGQGSIRLSYVEFTVPPGNAWSGVHLQLAGSAGNVVFRPSTQVGALEEATDRWIYLTTTEIDSGLLEQQAHFKKKGARLRLFVATQEEHDMVVAKLAEHGINYRQAGGLQTADELLGSGGSEVEVAFTLNTNLRRCIAKYALNYLACICNSRFTLAQEFDAVREFARNGKLPDYQLVRSHFNPILANDEQTRRQTDGHLIVLSWDDTLQLLTCQVSIFNYITYDVMLCRQLTTALWRPIRSGHHYDLLDMTVRPLHGLPKNQAP